MGRSVWGWGWGQDQIPGNLDLCSDGFWLCRVRMDLEGCVWIHLTYLHPNFLHVDDADVNQSCLPLDTRQLHLNISAVIYLPRYGRDRFSSLPRILSPLMLSSVDSS